MKLLTCASYYSTGSSAVTNLIDECDNVHDMGDYEFRFVQDPDGICDLEYNLVLNNHRHNSGFALKRYEKKVDFLTGGRWIKKYNRFFGDNWQRLSKEYVHKLIDAEYEGYFHEDLIAKGKWSYFIERAVNKIYHRLFPKKSERAINVVMRNYTNYATYPGERFYEYTQDYIDRLFACANTDNKEFVMADQLVPASNTMHYLRFFHDLKVVCVERDPRDLFVLEKEVYHGGIIPQDVEKFCLWYKATRAHKKFEQDDPERVLRIHFEDMIYRYEEMVPKILSFCGISPEHHTKPKSQFNPAVSVRNTQVYKKYPQHAQDIRYIEQQLQDELYDFDAVADSPVVKQN